MSMKARLIAARALIADIANWTQGDYAKTRSGNYTRANADDAACFCALGAVSRQNNGLKLTADANHINNTSRNIYGEQWSTIRVNDEKGHADVLAVFDRAIETAPN